MPNTTSLRRALALLLITPSLLLAQTHPAQFVDPRIGTGGHGHTFPGPSVPFGMVQLSPDTRLSGWDGCSGYHDSDRRIYGFSHTHLSGTGCSDYGDVLLQPTMGKVRLSNKRYRSTFKKESEHASPGYYEVFLDQPQVQVALTATTHTGLHRYTFRNAGMANVLLDLTHRDRVKQGEITIESNTEISGTRISNAWANNQILYFVIQFSKPFDEAGIAKADVLNMSSKHDTGSLLKAAVRFNVNAGETIYARVGISAVSVEGARNNLKAEQYDFNFERTRQAAEAAWDKELGKIEITTRNDSSKRIFYTALYHCMLAPNRYQDVDGQYRGRDFNVHRANFDYYTVFSLWDTYRALHPLLTLIDKKRSADFVNTFIHQYEEGGRLPVWELSSCETWCMIGYHAIPVIAEAVLKGVTGFDQEKAYAAMRFSAMEDKNALDDYKKYGYIQFMHHGQSVSRTLEYAFDDWCIAQVAKHLGKEEDYRYFMQRGQSYKNLYDASTGFMRPRSPGFLTPFDPFKVDHNYTEGNAWQYSFYVPQDMQGHMQLLGGKEKLAAFLDSLFSASTHLTGHRQPDISGMIGQYVHGNEPSHQIAYEYNYAGQPWKTQAMVRRIMKEMYRAQPDGLCGNEDCGQMSAWYVFSALGFYPVCPGSGHYAIGSPLFELAVVHLENGKTITIATNANSAQAVYIQSATWNGQPYSKSFLTYEELAKGGRLELNMGERPNPGWASAEGDVPVTDGK
ncbi:MAG: GH92 family glycosyl hydrolase [Chitinophagales bacterium]